MENLCWFLLIHSSFVSVEKELLIENQQLRAELDQIKVVDDIAKISFVLNIESVFETDACPATVFII